MPTSAPPMLPGQHLEALLREKGLNQTEAAARLNMNRTYFNGVINGKNTISADLKFKLRDVLGVPVDYWNEVDRDQRRWEGSDHGKAVERAKSQEELYTMLDLRGHHVLVDHEVRQALRSRVIEITPFDLGRDDVLARLNPTTVDLTFGDHALMPSQEEGDVSYSLKGGFTLKRGKLATFETHERIVLTSRVRAIVHGLVYPWNSRFMQLFCERIVEPGSGSKISFGLLNQGPKDLVIEQGAPCLSVSFDYLAQDCTP